jgi:hypothetical protein
MKRRQNKSAAYGYYGGISKQQYYNPIAPGEYDKQLTNARFTEADRQRLIQAMSAAQFVNANAPNILLRVAVEQTPENIDTFVISTSGNPADTITYKTDKDKIVLDDMAGTGITSDSISIIDGGTF